MTRRPLLAPLALLAVLAPTPAPAALEFAIQTSRGNITVELDYARAPRGVANLLTLADGSRAWIDPADGTVRHDPFYAGLPFHQVTTGASNQRATVGSRTGVPDEHPGFFLPDEFDPTLSHSGYVLSMENEGPNTNGCRFSLTGADPQPARDGVHTVLGTIPDPASRTVVDAILAAGAGNTTITGISVQATDPDAQAFDPSAVPLPDVTVTNGAVARVADAFLWTTPLAPRQVLRTHRSTDLVTWSPQQTHLRGPGEPSRDRLLEVLGATAAFHRPTLVSHPDGDGPGHFANRTLEIQAPGLGTIRYLFDSTGLAGTYENIVFPGDPPFFAGPFTVRDETPPRFGPWSFRLLIEAEGLGNAPFNLIRGGYDSFGDGTAAGRHHTSLGDTPGANAFNDYGSLSLSGP